MRVAGAVKDARRLRRGLGIVAIVGLVGVIVTAVITTVMHVGVRGRNEVGQPFSFDCGTVLNPAGNCVVLYHRANLATWLVGISIGMCVLGGMGWLLIRSGHVWRLIPLAVVAIAIGFGAALGFHALSHLLIRNAEG